MLQDSDGKGLEGVLFRLLESEPGKNLNPGHVLITLSLVNLMGLIDLVGRRFTGQTPEKPAPVEADHIAGAEGTRPADTVINAN